MKLAEVAIPKKPEKVQEPYSDYIERLFDKRRSIPQLGDGAYATVFRHPQNKTVAVKVSEETRGILNYIQFAIKNHNNPYVPQIYNVRRFTNRGDVRYFIVFMERLRNFSNLSNQTRKKILYKHLGREFVDKVSAGLDGDVEDFFNGPGIRRTIVNHLQKQRTPQSKQLLKVLQHFLQSRANDVHDANIMVRGKDQIVFVDPAT